MTPLLQHVLDDRCSDPDCEVHEALVGQEEGTISQNDLAFWLAGISHLPAGDSFRKLCFSLVRARLGVREPEPVQPDWLYP